MITLKLNSLSGKFACVHSVRVATQAEALQAAREHAEPHGFTNFQIVTDEDEAGECFRITADPPKGRKGRNVAHGDYTDNCLSPCAESFG